MKREFEIPSLRVREFSKVIMLDKSNLAEAKSKLEGAGVTIERTTVKKVSELTDSPNQ